VRRVHRTAGPQQAESRRRRAAGQQAGWREAEAEGGRVESHYFCEGNRAVAGSATKYTFAPVPGDPAIGQTALEAAQAARESAFAEIKASLPTDADLAEARSELATVSQPALAAPRRKSKD